MVSGLHGNGFGTSVVTLTVPPAGPVNHFRQWFMVAGTLAFDLDREDARDFVPRKPIYRLTQWPRSLSRGESFIGQDFFMFLAANADDSLTSGSSYLRCV